MSIRKIGGVAEHSLENPNPMSAPTAKINTTNNPATQRQIADISLVDGGALTGSPLPPGDVIAVAV